MIVYLLTLDSRTTFVYSTAKQAVAHALHYATATLPPAEAVRRGVERVDSRDPSSFALGVGDGFNGENGRATVEKVRILPADY